MNQRLIWNFEFSAPKLLSFDGIVDTSTADLKWEVRYFWPETAIICLNTIDLALTDISHYEHKHKEDSYYLLPNVDYNIKRRRDTLLYKPKLKQKKQAVGFGPKINLEDCVNQPTDENQQLADLVHQVETNSTVVDVKKESFVYKFSTTPVIKLELARLEVHGLVFFSACVEGRSLKLVETISEHLLAKHVSCDYVTFLKKIK